MGEQLLTVAQVRERLPFKIGVKTLRRLLRSTGLANEHRRQLCLAESRLQAFVDEVFPCPTKSTGETRRARKVGASFGSGGPTLAGRTNRAFLPPTKQKLEGVRPSTG